MFTYRPKNNANRLYTQYDWRFIDVCVSCCKMIMTAPDCHCPLCGVAMHELYTCATGGKMYSSASKDRARCTGCAGWD